MNKPLPFTFSITLKIPAMLAAMYSSPINQLAYAFLAWDAFHAANPAPAEPNQAYTRARRVAFNALRVAAHRFTPAQLSKAICREADSLRYLLAAA